MKRRLTRSAQLSWLSRGKARWSRFPRYWVHDNLPILMMDQLAPCTGCNLLAGERVEGMLVHVVATWTMVSRERRESLERVNYIADVLGFGDARTTGHGVNEDCGNHRRRAMPLLRRVLPEFA